ncbi:MAG: dihydrodipicolinate synthase family protein [Dialister invisus]
MNTEELRAQIERLIDGGVHGIFPFGTNGEGYILSENEKVEVLEATIDQVKDVYLYMQAPDAFLQIPSV